MKTLSIVYQQKAELIDYIDKQIQSASGGRLNGEMLQTYIQRAFSISYNQNSIYKLLKSLNITWTTSRSKHPKQSEEAQENFKKTANWNDQVDPRTYCTR